MSVARSFVDSNVVLYLLSTDSRKADRAEAVLESGATLSVQVLNEVANVARRKLGMGWTETREFLAVLRAICPAEALTVGTHDRALRLAEGYSLSFYDALIAASALLAGCEVLLSEDMQHGLLIDRQLRVCNPFV